MNQGGTHLFGNLFPIVANTTGEVAIKAGDSGRRVVIAGVKSVRISIGAVLRGFQSIIEVRFITPQGCSKLMEEDGISILNLVQGWTICVKKVNLN